MLLSQIATVALFFTLILYGDIQTINQPEETVVTVGSNAGGTRGGEDVGLGPGITAELRQHIGPGTDIIGNAIVTTVVQRTKFAKLQAGKRQTRFVAGVVAFNVIGAEVIFPLAVADQLVVDLRFTFEAQTGIGLIAIF